MSVNVADLGRLIDTGQSPAGAHRLASFNRCPHLFARTYLLGERSPASWDQAEGTVLHAGLAHHYAKRRASPEDADLASPHDAIRATSVLVYQEDGHRVDAGKIIATLDRYVDTYKVAESRWRVLTIDTHYDTWIEDKVRGARYRFTPKPDLVVDDGVGVWFVDHKGTARIEGKGAKLSRTYSCDPGILGQRWAGPILFPGRFRGLILNLVQRDGENLTRPGLDPHPELLAAFPSSVVYTERRIADLLASGLPADRWPRALGGCWDRFGPCHHLDTACSWG